MENEKGSLRITHPKLAREWHPTLNGDITPDDVTKGVRKKVWWICKKGHEWQSAIYARSGGSGCPYCMGKLPIKGETDLASIRPDLAEEWHPSLNKALKPDEVCAASGKKVWWVCKKGHVWKTAILTRKVGKGCPYCAGNLPIEGETDLKKTRPDLAKEWHPAFNGELTPNKVTQKSNLKVWWKCEKGHEWQSVIANRSKGSGCPYCMGKLPINGETDLATLRPALAKEWHPTKNRLLGPEDVTVSSGKKVWWMCEKGHEYLAQVCDRSYKKNGCPYCSGRMPINGETDLATLCPMIVLDWDAERNGKNKPDDYTVHSGKKANWKCHVCGTKWRSSIYERSIGNSNCPRCRNASI